MSGVRNAVHSLERDLDRAQQVALDHLILRTTVGSVVHGLSNPGTDDRDEMGVCIEPPEYLLGFKRFEHFVYRTQPEGHPSGPDDLDLTVYGLRKFCVLALKGSPTTLLPLYVTSEHQLVTAPAGEELRGLAGELALDDVLERIDAATVQLEELADDPSLPARPDVARVDAFLVRTYRGAWG